MNEDEIEWKRLSILGSYQVLDTAAEKAYDHLTNLAAAVCDAPISLVSFVDEKRQWFKARTGLTVSETPREHSFCAHVICGDETVIVEDATKDERFKDNPLVTDSPQIRFYAASPLTVQGGWHLGTLCVIDKKPRKLLSAQMKALEVIRDAVVTQLEYRRAVEDVKELASLLPMCTWCRSVKLEGEREEVWIPLHKYVAKLGPVQHGICPSCRSQVVLDGD
ncbi:MAG: GAF domain-containing protein [Woeseiaceae bacterium]